MHGKPQTGDLLESKRGYGVSSYNLMLKKGTGPNTVEICGHECKGENKGACRIQ